MGILIALLFVALLAFIMVTKYRKNKRSRNPAGTGVPNIPDGPPNEFDSVGNDDVKTR